MNPKDYTLTILQNWINAESDKKHSMAVKYIEENVDLIDTDLQKFMDDCPKSCQLEVYEMLLKAGIDMEDYAVKNTLKKWDNYIHNATHYPSQYYTIDYQQQMDEYITDTIKCKINYQPYCIVLDTISAVEEA